MNIIDSHPWLAERYRRLLMWGWRRLKGIDPEKVVFSCFQGRAYGDNPRFISERLHERYPKAKIVWLFNRAALNRLQGKLPDYIRCVEYKRHGALMELATARVWVDNFTKHSFLRWPKGRQFYVQTWHGDRPIKKICYDIGIPGDRRIEERCDRVVSGSEFGERVYRTAFRYRGAFIGEGCPRNDMLVKNDPKQRRRIRESLGVGEEIRLLLYAPTYRENTAVIPRRAQMDLARTLNCLEMTTGDQWVCLYRAHYLSEGIDLQAVKDRIIDVTAYPEMSELLLAADMLLTDYSSCAFDYILTGRPALFFASDWEEYLSTRGVYFDIHDAPLMLAEDQEGLEGLIRELTPERIRQNCQSLREYFGCHETGRATDAVCDYIIERLGSKQRIED